MQRTRIERLYCDASYLERDGIGGMAVVAPERSLSFLRDGSLQVGRGSDSRVRIVKGAASRDSVILCAACPCRSSQDAEKRAMSIAFIVGWNMLEANECDKVEIVSDCRNVLRIVMSGDTGGDELLTSMHRLWREGRVILAKVQAHNGHWGNELADDWAKCARIDYTKKLKKHGGNAKMRIPFNNNGYGSNGGFGGNSGRGSFGSGRNRGRRNPFDGASEVDIRTLTERALSSDSDIGYVTPEGQIMPRNTAFGSGYDNGIELQKKRIWGLGMADEPSADDTSALADRGLPCGEVPIHITFSGEAQDAMYLESQRCSDTETGGALIGTWGRSMDDGSISVYVERATGPGALATKQHALFSPHLNYYRSRVAWYRKNMGWDYLGEWHKHPGSFDTLSGTDVATAEMLIRDEGWPMLLLPIINLVDGSLVVENHAVLSKQIGGGVYRHISGLTLEKPRNASALNGQNFTVFIDREIVDSFAESDEETSVVEGVFNPSESCVFMSLPGSKNAVLRLVRSGENVPVSGLENVITGVLSNDGGLHCWCSVEGDIVPAKHVIIDPANSIYERNAGLTETDALKDMTVTLVGCGSLGSTLALSLARAGVGTFRLFDMDDLSPVNIARHQAGLRDLGRAKAAVLRDLIHCINPTINVDVNVTDIVNSVEGYEDLCEAAIRSDLLVCTTDTDDSRRLVNDTAIENGVKVIQAGLHERAASGIIHFWEPGSDEACWACHRDRVISESSKRAEGVSYSEARDIRDLTVQPGLAAQINFVAEAAALRCIDALMDRHSLPSMTVIGVDWPQEAPDGDDANVAATGERSLRLITRHLILERSDTCPACSAHEETADDGDDASTIPDDFLFRDVDGDGASTLFGFADDSVSGGDTQAASGTSSY